MKNLLFHLKAVKTGTLKALVGARAGSGAGAGAGAETLKVGAEVGVGAVTKSFGSATLYQGVILSVCRPVTSVADPVPHGSSFNSVPGSGSGSARNADSDLASYKAEMSNLL
jgi:hypothetical protein